ncbi:MAG: lycopene cyclase domain-containing protein, partial [Mangrovibacterium sp.]
MQSAQFIYTGLLLIILAIPVLLSFGPKIQYYSKWKYLFPAILLTALVFVFWNVRFTQVGIWNFNPEYTLGINYMKIPLEEWLFFLVFPFFSMFIYEGVKSFSPSPKSDKLLAAFSLILTVAFGLISYLFRQHAYTFFTFLILTVYLGYTIFRNRFRHHLSHFYLTYVVCLVPFLIVRGILTS